MTPYSSVQIANAFLNIVFTQSYFKSSKIDRVKLQNLVVIADMWHIKLTNGKKLIDEDIQAWHFGPVIPSLHHNYKLIHDEFIETYLLVHEGDNQFIEKNDTQTYNLIDKIWEVYGKSKEPYEYIPAVRSAWSKRWEEMKKEGLQKSAIPIQYIIDAIKI